MATGYSPTICVEVTDLDGGMILIVNITQVLDKEELMVALK